MWQTSSPNWNWYPVTRRNPGRQLRWTGRSPTNCYRTRCGRPYTTGAGQTRPDGDKRRNARWISTGHQPGLAQPGHRPRGISTYYTACYRPDIDLIKQSNQKWLIYLILPPNSPLGIIMIIINASCFMNNIIIIKYDYYNVIVFGNKNYTKEVN